MGISLVQKRQEAIIATGIDDDEELELNATNEEKERGDTTRVTVLRNDEVDPS